MWHTALCTWLHDTHECDTPLPVLDYTTHMSVTHRSLYLTTRHTWVWHTALCTWLHDIHECDTPLPVLDYTTHMSMTHRSLYLTTRHTWVWHTAPCIWLHDTHEYDTPLPVFDMLLCMCGFLLNFHWTQHKFWWNEFAGFFCQSVMWIFFISFKKNEYCLQ